MGTRLKINLQLLVSSESYSHKRGVIELTLLNATTGLGLLLMRDSLSLIKVFCRHFLIFQMQTNCFVCKIVHLVCYKMRLVFLLS